MTPERKAKITRVLNHRQPDLTVVLENVHDPHNISAIMRTCDAVGVQDLYILNTRLERHEKFGKRSSASAAGWITIHDFDNIETCVTALRKRYTKLYATHLSAEASSLYEMNMAEPVALIFGNEHSGVSDELLSFCDGNFIIPQVGMIHSLNISVACAVTLYEAFRQRQLQGFYNGKGRLPEDEKAVLANKWKLYE